MAFTFRGPGGSDPVRSIIRLRDAAKVTIGDALYAGQRQRSRILERTARHIDAEGRPFAQYSSKRPYYYYPTGKVRRAGLSIKQRQAQSGRMARQLGAAKTRLGIKFPGGYREFKLQGLGRSGVDLRGPRQPHMLASMLLKVGAVTDRGGLALASVGAYGQPANEIRLGFYGEEAIRAKGNNEGAGRLPRRRFFAASRQDIQFMQQDIGSRIAARIRAGR